MLKPSLHPKSDVSALTFLVAGDGDMAAPLQSALRQRGLDVEAAGPSDALEMTRAAVPDLVVLVGRTAQRGGARLVKAFRADADLSRTPILVVGAEGHIGDANAAYLPEQLGCEGLADVVLRVAHGLIDGGAETGGLRDLVDGASRTVRRIPEGQDPPPKAFDSQQLPVARASRAPRPSGDRKRPPPLRLRRDTLSGLPAAEPPDLPARDQVPAPTPPPLAGNTLKPSPLLAPPKPAALAPPPPAAGANDAGARSRANPAPMPPPAAGAAAPQAAQRAPAPESHTPALTPLAQLLNASGAVAGGTTPLGRTRALRGANARPTDDATSNTPEPTARPAAPAASLSGPDPAVPARADGEAVAVDVPAVVAEAGPTMRGRAASFGKALRARVGQTRAPLAAQLSAGAAKLRAGALHVRRRASAATARARAQPNLRQAALGGAVVVAGLSLGYLLSHGARSDLLASEPAGSARSTAAANAAGAASERAATPAAAPVPTGASTQQRDSARARPSRPTRDPGRLAHPGSVGAEAGDADEAGGADSEASSQYASTKALQRRVDRANHWIQEGHRLRKRGRLGLAEAAYLRSLKELPRYPRAMAGLVRVHLQRKAGAEAVRWARKLVQVQPKRGYNQLLLGDAYRLLGKRAPARDAWRTAVRYGNREARKRLDARR